MRIILTALIIFAFTATVSAETLDYSKLEPEHFNNLENKMEFSDEKGNNYRIKNSDYSRGLYIQVTVNGNRKWEKHGAYYSIYNGRVSGMITYAYGKREGVKETYNHDGITTFRTYYQNDLKHGSWEQFNDKGVKVAECTYVKNEKQGKYYNYAGGNLNFEKIYVDDKRHGESLQYDTTTGKLVAKTMYNMGNKVGKTQWY